LELFHDIRKFKHQIFIHVLELMWPHTTCYVTTQKASKPM